MEKTPEQYQEEIDDLNTRIESLTDEVNAWSKRASDAEMKLQEAVEAMEDIYSTVREALI